ncbi:MAG: cysteine desulfurase [Clostridia bacterium]|nr:cysteine desulfurase [Clostridia bacterium]
MEKIYLDHAATSPLREKALEKMISTLKDVWGNAASVHSFGREARRAVEESRERIAALIGAKPGEVYFTSGGSESDTWAILCMPSGHCVTTAIEHHAAMNAFEALEKRGTRVDRVLPGRDGAVKAEDVLDRVGPDTGLVSVMTANNETGVIQPVKEIGEKLRERGVPFHTDAVQALGQIPVDVDSLGCSLLSASAHKFGGPKGIGILYIRSGTGIGNLIHGGLQQRGLRPGTEDPAGCVGMAAALEEAVDEMEDAGNRIREMRDTLIRLVRERVPDAVLNGRTEGRLFCNANIRFPGIDGSALLMRLDMEGVAASAGSACTAGVVETSHVLTAMGLTEKEASESIRFTLGRENTPQEIQRTAEIISGIVNDMRA